MNILVFSTLTKSLPLFNIFFKCMAVSWHIISFIKIKSRTMPACQNIYPTGADSPCCFCPGSPLSSSLWISLNPVTCGKPRKSSCRWHRLIWRKPFLLHRKHSQQSLEPNIRRPSHHQHASYPQTILWDLLGFKWNMKINVFQNDLL